jgi:hypothetical protein
MKLDSLLKIDSKHGITCNLKETVERKGLEAGTGIKLPSLSKRRTFT